MAEGRSNVDNPSNLLRRNRKAVLGLHRTAQQENPRGSSIDRARTVRIINGLSSDGNKIALHTDKGRGRGGL